MRTIAEDIEGVLTHLPGLLDITKGCNVEMHEPDEQGLKVRVIGDHLDNACGEYISEKALTEGFQEFVVCIERFDEDGEGSGAFTHYRINLATLIALARMAKEPVQSIAP